MHWLLATALLRARLLLLLLFFLLPLATAAVKKPVKKTIYE